MQPNPRAALAREGVQLALESGAELILAVGGGSVIDTCKAIAHGAANPGTDIWEFWKRRAPLTRSMPVGVVLTIPAAGSETSDSAVLTNAEAGEKRGLNTPFNRPAFAILDPLLAATLPVHQVACGVSDILMHTLDRYFNPVTDNALTDELAEALLRVVLEYGPAAVRDAHDEKAMSEIMWAGSLSHNGLTGLGGRKDFATHQLGHALSEKFDVYHGDSLTAVWSSWARSVMDESPARFARFARNVWHVEEADDTAAALAEEKDLDLVKIAPNAVPPVCKIMDYGKFRFEQLKKEKEAKKNQKVVEIKEIRMSPSIDTNDFNTKVKSAVKFLNDGNRVKVTVRFRGREMAHTSLGQELLAKFGADCSEIATIAKDAKLEGRNMSMFLSPKNSK